MSQLDVFVTAMLAKVGSPYKDAPLRCVGPYFDCSGLQCYGLDRAGAGIGCTDSMHMGAYLRADPARQLSQSQARATFGAWLVRDPSHTGHGHVVCSLGDGRTVEAYDTADGVIRGHIDGRIWDVCGYAPVSGYGAPHRPPPGPNDPGEARNMTGMTAAKLVPGGHAQAKPPWLGRRPFVGSIVQPDLTTDIVGYNGAVVSINGHLGTNFMGMSVLKLGVLRAAIETIDEVDSNTLIGLAGDGGTFQFDVAVHYL